MAKKVGTLIKEARTAAGLTQEQLAKKVGGLTASDISKAERGEKTLTQEQLKSIARITGVTQKSLLEAPGGKTASAGKASSGGKTAGAKTGSGSKSSSMTLSAEEKKLVQLYRKADEETQKAAVKLLKGEDDGGDGSLLGTILETAIGMLSGKG